MKKINTQNKVKMNIRYIVFLMFFTLSTMVSYAQVHVASPNNVKMGKESIISNNPGVAEIVDIFGSLYVSHEPMTGPFSGGVYFNQFNHIYNGIPYNTPIMQPQWDNAYWIGRSQNQIWRVYSQ